MASTADTEPCRLRRVLTETELAERWHVSTKTLQGWRAKRTGPAFLKFGRCVRYPLDAVEAAEERAA